MTAVALAAVSGCSGQDDDSAADSSDRTASPVAEAANGGGQSASPDAPGSSTPVDVGEQYLDWVTPSNCALARYSEVEAAAIGADGGFTLDEWDSIRGPLTDAAGEVADTSIAAIEAGVDLSWPDNVQTDVDGVLTGFADVARVFSLMAAATTVDEWNAGIAQFDSIQNYGSSAALVRAKLGLDTNLVDVTTLC